MPHYDMYMKALVAKKMIPEIDATFETVRALAGDTSIWTIYIRALAQTRSLGDAFAMEKAAQANLYPASMKPSSLFAVFFFMVNKG